MFKIKKKKIKEKKKYIPYCPRCKSLKLSCTLMGIIGGYGLKCEECGYRGICPEIEVEKVGELKKMKKKKIKRKGK